VALDQGSRSLAVVHHEARRGLRHTLPLLTVALVLLVASCGRQPHPTLSELKEVPGAQLSYPGSFHEVAKAVESNHKFGPNPAFFGVRGFTNDSESRVLDYFQNSLQSQGWSHDINRICCPEEWAATRAFKREGRFMVVAIVSTPYRQRAVARDKRYADYATVYETLIQ
jgi:hypothetical protein